MIHKEFIPLQEKVEMYFKVNFKHKFEIFANAFMKKYNTPNSMSLTTIWKVSQIDDDKFAFVRRYDTIISSTPFYERVIYDRKNEKIEAVMMDDESEGNPMIAEKWVYKAEGDSTIYETFLYKNPGWKSWMRTKLHSWGVDTMNSLLEKEKEIFKEKKELMLQKKEELKLKKAEFIKNVKSFSSKKRNGNL